MTAENNNITNLMHRERHREVGVNKNENRRLSREQTRLSVDRKDEFDWNNVKKFVNILCYK